MKLSERVYLVASGRMGFDWTSPGDCNVYLLNGGDELALVDTGTGESVSLIMENIERHGFLPRQIEHVLLTHLHADHSGGAAQVRELTGAKVAGHHEGRLVLETADEAGIDLDRARSCGFYPSEYVFKACPLDRPLRDGEEFTVGTLRIRVRLLPGHSRFDAYYFMDDGSGQVSLFSGDGVFFDGKISMLNTRDSNIQDLARSIEQLSSESVEALFPGHLQPALRNGSRHVEKACQIFANMMIPPSIL